jgi:hypothetical protein
VIRHDEQAVAEEPADAGQHNDELDEPLECEGVLYEDNGVDVVCPVRTHAPTPSDTCGHLLMLTRHGVIRSSDSKSMTSSRKRKCRRKRLRWSSVKQTPDLLRRRRKPTPSRST